MTPESPLHYSPPDNLPQSDGADQAGQDGLKRDAARSRRGRNKPPAEEAVAGGGDVESGRYTVGRYAYRSYEVRDGDELIAVTVYKKGADEVRRQLASRDRRISDLEAKIAALVSRLTGREGP